MTFETKERAVHRTVTISISLLDRFVSDAMNANTVGNKCLERIFIFAQKHFQYMIQVMQSGGRSFYKKDGSVEFL